jgi:choline kinase
MEVVLFAARIGAGLGNSRTLNLPNIVLRFDDRSLLQRHLFILKRSSIEELVLGVGFNRDGVDYSVDPVATNAEILPRLSASTRHASPNAVTDVGTGRMSKHERC